MITDELFSPIITPLILIFNLSHKSQDIVDFFRNFTVDVVGVGDVCSFAQMDVRRHGNPGWQVEREVENTVARTNNYTQVSHCQCIDLSDHRSDTGVNYCRLF